MQLKLFLSKRGQEQKISETTLLIIVGVLVVLFAIFLPTITIANNLKEDSSFKRDFLAIDIATTLTAISNSPGNLYVDYPEDTLWFSYEFEKNNLKVTDDSQTVETHSNYPVVEDKGLVYIYKELNPDFNDESSSKEDLKQAVKIRFEKQNNEVSFYNPEKLPS